jgi:hypothetical protein
VRIAWVAAATALTLTMAMPVGAATKAQLQSETLRLSDMPPGWSVDTGGSGSASGWTGCLATLEAAGEPTQGIVRATVQYALGPSLPSLAENLISGRNAVRRYDQFVSILNSCTTVSLIANGTTLSGDIGAMSFPTVGDGSYAYSVSLRAHGATLRADIVLFRLAGVAGEVSFNDYGTPDMTQLRSFVAAAVDRIERKTPPPPPSSS